MSSATANHQPSSSVAIVGAGDVGGAIASALISSGVAAHVLLVDTDARRRDGQALDLADAAAHHRGAAGVRVRAGTHAEAGQCDIVVITAGAKQRPGKRSPLALLERGDRMMGSEADGVGAGENRLDLLHRNVAIMTSVIDSMRPLRADGILLVVANPVDVLTRFAQVYAGLPVDQVIGSGTLLDSVRLRGMLAEEIDVGLLLYSRFLCG
jgi:L-lactate dehydrogenase